jgi:uncharacterized iron-regulated membrane protein
VTTLTIRRWHTYIGLFSAPSVIFFALTGAAQLFQLHEPHGDYHPPPLMEKLGSVHKDQVFRQPPAREAKEAERFRALGGHSGADKDSPDEPQNHQLPGTLLLTWFFLLVALGLCVSSCLGTYLGLTQSRRKLLSWSLLIVGFFIPVTVLVLS